MNAACPRKLIANSFRKHSLLNFLVNEKKSNSIRESRCSMLIQWTRIAKWGRGDPPLQGESTSEDQEHLMFYF